MTDGWDDLEILLNTIEFSLVIIDLAIATARDECLVGRIRRETRLPVLVLATTSAVAERVLELNRGADD